MIKFSVGDLICQKKGTKFSERGSVGIIIHQITGYSWIFWPKNVISPKDGPYYTLGLHSWVDRLSN